MIDITMSDDYRAFLEEQNYNFIINSQIPRQQLLSGMTPWKADGRSWRHWLY